MSNNLSLVDYSRELQDILNRLNQAKQNFKHLNSLKLNKHIQLMEESIFRIEHQINKELINLDNGLYIESNDTSRPCMYCNKCKGNRWCKIRDHRVNAQYGSCPKFEE